MDISDIFEIYDIEKIDDNRQVLVTRCTTEYRSNDYEVNTDGLLNLKREIIQNDSIEGDKYQFVLNKNTASAKIVEKKLNKIKLVLSKKGPDIKFERQVIYLDKVKSITALIFLNMAPLHETEFGNILFFKAQQMLQEIDDK